MARKVLSSRDDGTASVDSGITLTLTRFAHASGRYAPTSARAYRASETSELSAHLGQRSEPILNEVAGFDESSQCHLSDFEILPVEPEIEQWRRELRRANDFKRR